MPSCSRRHIYRHAAACALVLVIGCHRTSAPGQAQPQLPGLQFASGEKKPTRSPVAPVVVGTRLFASLCASCHGEDGRGDTPLAGDLNPVPQDLTRCNFKQRSTPSGTLPTDDDLLRTLYVGLPGSAMPSFGEVLSLPVLRALVVEAKRRCDRMATGESAGETLSVLGAPGAANASVARGRRIYRREGCHSCHGESGAGDGAAAGSLKDDQGRGIRPRDHTRGVFRAGFTAADIYRAFSTGLDGTPMPSLPEQVSGTDRWDLTRFVWSLSAGRPVERVLTEPPSWYEPALTRRPPWRGK